MRAFDELVERLAMRRGERLGNLSAGAYEELVLAVRRHPEDFVDGDDDQAFLLVAQALARYGRARSDEELLEDDGYLELRTRRMRRLVRDCQNALRVDVNCLDAALLAVLAADGEPAVTLDALLELDRHVRLPEGDAWADVRQRSVVRLRAAIARACLDTGRYRMAASVGEGVISASPRDPLGCRHTCALAYARLEDETSFDALDVRFDRHGSAWSHLGRCLLLYKLGRMTAARRALAGYSQLIEGGAYALLRPTALETYLPDRLEVAERSYDAATMAVWEAEPIIVDVPGFVAWAAEQSGFGGAAEAFARRCHFDW